MNFKPEFFTRFLLPIFNTNAKKYNIEINEKFKIDYVKLQFKFIFMYICCCFYCFLCYQRDKIYVIRVDNDLKEAIGMTSFCSNTTNELRKLSGNWGIYY